MKTAILAVLMLVSTSSFAEDFTFDPPKSDWSSSDTYRELGFQGLWLIDALQTHQIVKSRQATTLLVAPLLHHAEEHCVSQQSLIRHTLMVFWSKIISSGNTQQWVRSIVISLQVPRFMPVFHICFLKLSRCHSGLVKCTFVKIGSMRLSASQELMICIIFHWVLGLGFKEQAPQKNKSGTRTDSYIHQHQQMVTFQLFAPKSPHNLLIH